MIQLKELRIGNFIQSCHGIVKVNQINENYFITEPNLIGATHGGIYSHINLTKDFLIKNGFVNDGCYCSNDRWGVDIRDMNFFIKGKFGNDCPNIIYLCQCKYVNTFQNIIYSLTGSELEVAW